MPIILFGMLFGIIGMQNYQLDIKEQKINELCTQKFQNLEEIQQCKAILIKMH